MELRLLRSLGLRLTSACSGRSAARPAAELDVGRSRVGDEAFVDLIREGSNKRMLDNPQMRVAVALLVDDELSNRTWKTTMHLAQVRIRLSSLEIASAHLLEATVYCAIIGKFLNIV